MMKPRLASCSALIHIACVWELGNAEQKIQKQEVYGDSRMIEGFIQSRIIFNSMR